jgi:uncharacterized membrane protein
MSSATSVLFEQQQTQLWLGPLPSPESLAKYNEASPGAAKIILDAFQSQGAHRQEIEKAVVIGGARRASQGLWMGGSLAALSMILSFILIIQGYPIIGVVLWLGEIASVFVAFVYGKREQKEERVEKAKAISTAIERTSEGFPPS